MPPDDVSDNQSPDTITDDDGSTVSIGEIADAVVERLKGLIPGAGGDSAPPSVEAPTAALTEPAAVAASPAPVSNVSRETSSDVEAAVERVLARKDTDARLGEVEAKVSAPPAPKPKRTGVAALIFGPDRA